MKKNEHMVGSNPKNFLLVTAESSANAEGVLIHLPKSFMGKALRYALGQWPMPVAFLKDGQIEIDNNLCENAIRPTDAGKKNWLFIGAKDVGAGVL